TLLSFSAKHLGHRSSAALPWSQRRRRAFSLPDAPQYSALSCGCWLIAFDLPLSSWLVEGPRRAAATRIEALVGGSSAKRSSFISCSSQGHCCQRPEDVFPRHWPMVPAFHAFGAGRRLCVQFQRLAGRW